MCLTTSRLIGHPQNLNAVKLNAVKIEDLFQKTTFAAAPH